MLPRYVQRLSKQARSSDHQKQVSPKKERVEQTGRRLFCLYTMEEGMNQTVAGALRETENPFFFFLWPLPPVRPIWCTRSVQQYTILVENQGKISAKR